MMILQMSTESALPVFKVSSVFEREKLDIKEYDKKSTRLRVPIAIYNLRENSLYNDKKIFIDRIDSSPSH